MAVIPAKVQARLMMGIKKFQPILNAAKTKDINESDTVVIITDMLTELFGFDKYSEITSEYAIKKTFCDLAIKVNGKLRFLLEAKAVGLDLKDDYIKQAIDYGANEGVDWVILSNGYIWRVYKISFAKPIDKEMVYEIDFQKLNPKKQSDLDMLYCISKEGLGKSVLEEYHLQKQALSRFFIGQIIITEGVLDSIRRALKKVSPDAKITNDEIKLVLLNEVLKREVLEGEKVEEAKRKVNKIFKPIVRKVVEKTSEPNKDHLKD
ncbi:MAG: type I restriction enzyme HsdR N-terminal domain-containing protein [Clostridia bacterium]|jgi:predicted type IV restriction endonuclease|nr:type I restriction enzyme HsdR N-terminal domain-containing protein [Clostridia bacterium]